MELQLIRHGKTKGNERRCYIGSTDEPLSESGIQEIKQKIEKTKKIGIRPKQRLYVSPMLRCRETASLLFPRQEQIIVEDLRECDFGLFERKSYEELKTDPKYQAWMDSGGKLPFPEGEAPDSFRIRTAAAFCDSLNELIKQGIDSAAFVVHGGTIMSVMEAYAWPRREFYSYQTDNAKGYLLQFTEQEWTRQEIRTWKEI